MHFSKWKGLNDPMEGIFIYPWSHENDKISHNLQSAKNQWTIACMSASDTTMLMWSHYADSHKGLCLGFELDEGELRNSSITKGCMIYDMNLTKLAKAKESKINAEDHLYYLKRKLCDWEYEREVRLFIKKPEKGNHKIGTLKKVIIGKCFGEGKLRTEFATQFLEECRNILYVSEMNLNTSRLVTNRPSDSCKLKKDVLEKIRKREEKKRQREEKIASGRANTPTASTLA